MKYIIFILLISSYSASSYAFECNRSLKIKLETDQTIRFCELETLQISEKCIKNKSNCEILKEPSLISKNKTEFKTLPNQNPGSTKCHQLGWKVLMGKMADGSDVCVCQHPKGEYIVCTSMLL